LELEGEIDQLVMRDVPVTGPKRTLAVIPYYNEDTTIGGVILKAKKYVDEVTIIFFMVMKITGDEVCFIMVSLFIEVLQPWVPCLGRIGFISRAMAMN